MFWCDLTSFPILIMKCRPGQPLLNLKWSVELRNLGRKRVVWTYWVLESRQCRATWDSPLILGESPSRSGICHVLYKHNIVQLRLTQWWYWEIFCFQFVALRTALRLNGLHEYVEKCKTQDGGNLVQALEWRGLGRSVNSTQCGHLSWYPM